MQQQVQIVRVDDPSALPLPSQPGANPQVIGVNFSGGISSVVSQLNAALGQTHLQFANPSGNTLQVVTNSADNVTMNSASTTTTVDVADERQRRNCRCLRMRVRPIPGAITSSGSELTGLGGTHQRQSRRCWQIRQTSRYTAIRRRRRPAIPRARISSSRS